METEKLTRLLYLYQDLLSGDGIQKKKAAARFGVNERSIQRDIEDLRNFFAEQMPPKEIRYNAKKQRYQLAASKSSYLDCGEVLAVCKILLESRSMVKEEMLPILDKLLDCCVPAENKRSVQKLLANEKLLYVEPHHGKNILQSLWELGQSIQHQRVIEVEYQKQKDRKIVARMVEPVGLLFSEYYFYLVGFIRNIDRRKEFENPDDLFPTIYRVDRIQSFRETGETFSVPYSQRFSEGEFRKRIQFMYGGTLQTVKFYYTGPSVEAVLDRLPTAEILEEQDGRYLIRAEVFGKGIDMWLRSQGEHVTIC